VVGYHRRRVGAFRLIAGPSRPDHQRNLPQAQRDRPRSHLPRLTAHRAARPAPHSSPATFIHLPCRQPRCPSRLMREGRRDCPFFNSSFFLKKAAPRRPLDSFQSDGAGHDTGIARRSHSQPAPADHAQSRPSRPHPTPGPDRHPMMPERHPCLSRPPTLKCRRLRPPPERDSCGAPPPRPASALVTRLLRP
jgi:hypothetical protein